MAAVPSLVPGLPVVGLFILWAAHDGGYDADTWYWGALVVLGLLACALIALGSRRRPLGRPLLLALGFFALYVGWSYASILWAQNPGLALDGSNKALLYLLVFSLLAILPWTAEAALAVLLVFVCGIGVIAVVLLVRLGAADRLGALIVEGRLASPIGYFNGTAALFTMEALTAIALAARRSLPGLLRGSLVALGGASLQLAVIVQSRGWLFTLPLVVVLFALLIPDRLRAAVAGAIAAVITVIPIHHLLAIYDNTRLGGLQRAAGPAGQEALVYVGAAFVVGTVLAWFDGLDRGPSLSAGARRALGTVIVIAALLGAGAGGFIVSHGDPAGFISRQWHGFSHEQSAATASHFTDVGGGRYDIWRVAVDGFLHHPIGGLGQDNFGDYYLPHRRTAEEPAWTHSLELRFLTHTGAVGFVLFFGFLICALTAALRARRATPPAVRAVVAIALVPLIDWVVHGSLDWFWELPALAGPALGFLAIAAAQDRPPGRVADSVAPAATRTSRRLARVVPVVALSVAGIASAIVLGFCYLSVREVSIGSDFGPAAPAAAMRHLASAASLNPLSLDPERIAGTIALRIGEDRVAARRFAAATERDPGDWFSWLGAGLAASGLHHVEAAVHDFRVAASINRLQPAATVGLARARGAHPLTAAQAFAMLVNTA